MPNQRLPQVRLKTSLADAQAAAEAAAKVQAALASEPPLPPPPDDWFEAEPVKPVHDDLADRFSVGAYAHQPDPRTELAKRQGASGISWAEEEVIAAIRKYNGNLTATAQALGATRRTLLRYRQAHPEVEAVCQEVWESKIDNVESVLYNRAIHGESWAVTFMLKTQGRGRGYIERGETLNVRLDLNKLTDEQLRRIANGEHPTIVMGDPGAGGVGGAQAGLGDGRVIDGEAELLLDAPAETETGAAESGA